MRRGHTAADPADFACAALKLADVVVVGAEIFDSEFDRIEVELIGQLVHEGFHGETGGGMAGGAQGAGGVFVGVDGAGVSEDVLGVIDVWLIGKAAVGEAAQAVLFDADGV